MKLISKFIRLPTKEKRFLAEAVFFLFFSKLFLLFLPFRVCIRYLRTDPGNSGHTDPETSRKIRNAVSRANKLAFWKNVCLVSSFAARFMLQRRNIESILFLGLQFKNGKELIAHAWLMAGEIAVTPKGRTAYKEIFKI